jgi:hypothetical protein
VDGKDIESVRNAGATVLELKLQYLQTLAAKVDDHAAYLEAASKVIGLLPDVLSALRVAAEAEMAAADYKVP